MKKLILFLALITGVVSYSFGIENKQGYNIITSSNHGTFVHQVEYSNYVSVNSSMGIQLGILISSVNTNNINIGLSQSSVNVNNIAIGLIQTSVNVNNIQIGILGSSIPALILGATTGLLADTSAYATYYQKSEIDSMITKVNLAYFLSKDLSGFVTGSYIMYSTGVPTSVSTITWTGTTVSGVVISSFVVRIGDIQPFEILAGIVNLHVHVDREAGTTRQYKLYGQLIAKSSTTGTVRLIATSETSEDLVAVIANVMGDGYGMHFSLGSNFVLNADERIMVLILENNIGTGGKCDINLYVGNRALSRVTVEVTNNVLQQIFLRKDNSDSNGVNTLSVGGLNVNGTDIITTIRNSTIPVNDLIMSTMTQTQNLIFSTMTTMTEVFRATSTILNDRVTILENAAPAGGAGMTTFYMLLGTNGGAYNTTTFNDVSEAVIPVPVDFYITGVQGYCMISSTGSTFFELDTSTATDGFNIATTVATGIEVSSNTQYGTLTAIPTYKVPAGNCVGLKIYEINAVSIPAIVGIMVRYWRNQ